MWLLIVALNHWYSTFMSDTPQKTPSVNSRSLLLPYALGLIIAMTIVHVVIAVTGGRVTVLAGALTAVVALGIVVWLRRNRKQLRRVRFGVVIAHTLAYVTVTTSFTLHLVIRVIALGSGGDASGAIGATLLGGSWFGATLVMSALWGLGLLIHLIGTVLGRGWED